MLNSLIAPRGVRWPWAQNPATMHLVSPIRLIQRGTIAMTNGVASNTATITSVDPNHSRLVYLGVTGASTEISSAIAKLAFTNATTITASRGASLNTTTVGFEVITYWPGVIRTVQRGTLNTASTATLATTLQTILGAQLDSLGAENNDATASTNMNSILWRMDLTNTTTITGARSGSDGTLTAGYQVIEWW